VKPKQDKEAQNLLKQKEREETLALVYASHTGQSCVLTPALLALTTRDV
jgi:hypothetical protein